MSGLGLTFLRRGGQSHPTAGSDYIKFADAEVERILMAKGVSSDGVGITKEDAAKVTNIQRWFNANTIIKSFPELVKFGVKKLEYNAFKNCTSLQIIDLSNIKEIGTEAFNGCSPLSGDMALLSLEIIGNKAFYYCSKINSFTARRLKTIGNSVFQGCTSIKFFELEDITSIDYNAFKDCTGLSYFICRANTPPTLSNASAFTNTNNCPIYVPDAAVEDYKAATNWKNYASRIKPLSEYQG